MSAYLLMFGLLAGNAVSPVPEISGARFESLAACEDAAAHPAAWKAYIDPHDAATLRAWCEPVQGAECVTEEPCLDSGDEAEQYSDQSAEAPASGVFLATPR